MTLDVKVKALYCVGQGHEFVVFALSREPHLARILGITHENGGIPSIKRISEGIVSLLTFQPLQHGV